MRIFDVANLVGSVSAISNRGQAVPDDKSIGIAVPKRNHIEVVGHIDVVISILEDLELTASLVSAREVRKILNEEATLDVPPHGGEPLVGWPPLSAQRLKHYCSEVRSRVRDELRSKKAFIVSSDKVKYFYPLGPIFGNDVSEKFPTCSEDIEESGKCLALERYTACVFHLMRVMERALILVADKLGATVKDRNDVYLPWGVIGANMADKIKLMNKEDPEKMAWTRVHSFFDGVNRAWRNDTMHPKNTYTEEQAYEVFGAVKSFMRHLAPLV